MIIDLDQEAKKWIQSKGSQLTVKILDVKLCCSPGVQEVVAVPGKPQMMQQYHEMQVDDLTIYVQRLLCGDKKLTLKMSGALFLKSIAAKME